MMPSLQPQKKTSERGFTLLELAIAMLILAILGGGIVTVIGEQSKMRQDKETKANVAEVIEAIMGYAVMKGKIPCADTNGDGSADDCSGQPAGTVISGTCPLIELGVTCKDGQGNALTYEVSANWADTGPADLQDDGVIVIGQIEDPDNPGMFIDLHTPARIGGSLSTGLYQETVSHYAIAHRMVTAGRLP